MTNNQPPTIKGIEKEFDGEFSSSTRTGNESVGFWWALNTDNPEVIKQFYRHKIEEIFEYLGMEELNAERELGWSRKDFEEALDTSDDYRELGEFDGHNQAVKKFNAKIKKVRTNQEEEIWLNKRLTT